MSERTYDRLVREMSAFEVDAAARLRASTRAERASLYEEVYDQHARQFPEVPTETTEGAFRYLRSELAFARRFVSSTSTVAEIGAGHCQLAVALAPYCRSIYAVDVADLSPRGSTPTNFKHVRTDGVRVPLPDESVDVAISNQVMEHLHPDDVPDQLLEITRVVRPGGCYICTTPNRLYGPHDVSGFYGTDACQVVDNAYVAKGLHLKEYTNMELDELLTNAGFRQTRYFAGGRGSYIEFPVGMLRQCENLVRRIPVKHRKGSKLLRLLLGARVVAHK
jgi:ubiquinone/menaquinone biosynthesis C-methylase UbiE